MRLWAKSVGRTVPETCALTPPDDVSILVNRVVFRCIMVALTQTERDFLMNWEPPQSPLMPRGTMLIVDSHTHLDRIISQTGPCVIYLYSSIRWGDLTSHIQLKSNSNRPSTASSIHIISFYVWCSPTHQIIVSYLVLTADIHPAISVYYVLG